MNERLAELIPSKALADNYVNRKIYGKLDFDVFDWARNTNTNLLIKGPTQSGKTLAFRAYAAVRQIPSITIDVGAAMDPSLTLSTWTRDKDGVLLPYDGLLTLALKQGDAVVILDECNMAHPKVMAAYHSLGDHRRYVSIPETGETVRGKAGILLGATMNPDYIGTTPIGQAFSARWSHIPWGYDPKVEAKLISPGLRTLADKLRNSEYIHTPVSTHLLMKFQDTVSQMGYQFAVGVFKETFSPDEAKGLGHALEVALEDQIRKELE